MPLPLNAPAMMAPITNVGVGAGHQRVVAPSAVSRAPGYFQPVPVASVLAGAMTGLSYSETISVQNGTAPYIFSIVGTLPPGVTASTSGVLSGIPTTAGTYSFIANVTDVNGFTGSQTFSISVNTPSLSGGNFGSIN